MTNEVIVMTEDSNLEPRLNVVRSTSYRLTLRVVYTKHTLQDLLLAVQSPVLLAAVVRRYMKTAVPCTVVSRERFAIHDNHTQSTSRL